MEKKFKMGPLQRKWVNFLKSNPELQHTGELGREVDGVNKMCCLGAAGFLAGTCEWHNGRLFETAEKDSATLNKSFDALGLRGAQGQIEENENWLTDYNDNPNYTWVDIACMIEFAPELFFTKPI